MADPEHFKILLRGVDDWNSWRREHPEIRPDLRRADLYVDLLNRQYQGIESRTRLYFDSDQDNLDWNAIEDQADRELEEAREELLAPDESGWPRNGADLRTVDFSGADLFNADLSRANLGGANLTKAELGNAVLIQADLRDATLAGAHMYAADLGDANLSGANLSGAEISLGDLEGANLSGADLSGTDLSGADLRRANLSAAKLPDAKLYGANLGRANLSKANLARADLTEAGLVETDLADAELTGSRIYGISAWRLKLSEKTKQQDLIITPKYEPDITADDIEVAQFIYLLLHNEKLQRTIDTITSKVVLILGRFSLQERKNVLDALRDELRRRNYVPVVFDFEKPRSQTTINTVMLLARMARFVIADISDAKSVLQELQAIVPNSPKLPVQPIIVATQDEPGMFDSFQPYPWFLAVYRYNDPVRLLAELNQVISPAEAKLAQLRT